MQSEPAREDEMVRVPSAEIADLREQADRLPSLKERHELLSGFMQHRAPAARRPSTHAKKAANARKKQVRNAQRESRRMNRRRRKR